MRYEGRIYRPPSEAHSYILQATIGCSWNKCTYCDMYRDKQFRARPLDAVLADIEAAGRLLGERTDTVFVADGDALVLAQEAWLRILAALRAAFPRLRRVSCYAMASNVLAKTDAQLHALRREGLVLLYIGPESGDDVVLKRIAKGSTHEQHVEAAARVHAAGMQLSTIFLLGAGGTELSQQHAAASAALATAMDPEFLAALTLTVVPGTPQHTLVERRRFVLPAVPDLLRELRTFVAGAAPTDALFRTNHASNHLPLAGRLPRDRDRILSVIDGALRGEMSLRPEQARGL